MNEKFAIALLAISMLCTSALAQNDTANYWYQKGQELARNGSFQEAVKEYDRAIDKDPGNLDARLNKAMALYRAGRLNESIATQDDAVQAAIRYLGDLNRSVQAFNEVLDAVTSSSPAELAEAWDQRGFVLADLASSLGDNKSMYEEAIKYFDRSAELDPQRKDAWINKGAVLDTRLNKSAEALAAYDKAIELDGTNAGDIESLSNAWRGKSMALAKLERFNESLEASSKAMVLDHQGDLDAYDEDLKRDPQNASVWLFRGLALAGMGHGAEANQSYQKAVALLNKRLQEEPQDPEALWLKAEALDLLGKSEKAIEAYSQVAELNSSHALGAWIRESAILAALGRYNQSTKAFNGAMALVPASQSQSRLEFHRQRENTSRFTRAWLVDGHIHRISIGLYNSSLESFDEIEQINSDFVATLQLKDTAADPGRHGGSLLGSSLNWAIYSFNIPNTSTPDIPPILAITRINPKEDEFVEVTNGLKEAINLQNFSLELEGAKVALPEHSLLPGRAIRIHFDRGLENETDLFLNSIYELNDIAGSVSLRNDSGEDRATLNYSTKLDGSIAYSVTAIGNFAYTGPDSPGEMVHKAAGSGPFIAERVEIGPESALNNRSISDISQENTAEYWVKKGEELLDLSLIKNEGFEEAIGAFDNATEINPRNAEAWFKKADVLFFIALTEQVPDGYNKSLESLDRAIEIDSGYADAWALKGNVLLAQQRYDEALAALDNALRLDPEDSGGWITRADALANLHRYNESVEAYDIAIQGIPANATRQLASVWFQKSKTLLMAGRADEALNASNRAVELNPSDALAWNEKGRALLALGRQAEAQSANARAKELGYIPALAGEENTTAEYWMKEGHELLESGSFEKADNAFDNALEIYNQSIDANPMDSNAWLGKGNALSDFGRNTNKFNLSLAAYNRALEIDPKNIDAWIGKGRILCNIGYAKVDGVLYDEGRHNQSLAAFNRALDIDPENPKAWEGKAFALSVLGRINESIQAFDMAISLLPANKTDEISWAWAAKGNVLQMEPKRQEEAIAAFDRALEIDSKNSREIVLILKGNALKALGSQSEADAAYARTKDLRFKR